MTFQRKHFFRELSEQPHCKKCQQQKVIKDKIALLDYEREATQGTGICFLWFEAFELIGLVWTHFESHEIPAPAKGILKGIKGDDQLVGDNVDPLANLKGNRGTKWTFRVVLATRNGGDQKDTWTKHKSKSVVPR